ncbi:MAG: radical SAM protein [Mediterranea massiliensis]|nr:radical SAM protein [Mediterranea massiliensis]
MISRCYLEITNVCNLNCLFCPKTGRKKHCMTPDEFEILTNKLLGKIKFLYFHMMGEPLLHPHLPRFIHRAKEKEFVPIVTTNGTLLKDAHGVIDAMPYKVQISLHSQEGNGIVQLDEYIQQVMFFAQEASLQGIIVVLRLWNEGGYNSQNEKLVELIASHAPQPWQRRHDGWKIASNLYIEYDKMFEWPDSQHDVYHEDAFFCYALRNQIGILADGSVVPCCLDHDGDITLGNLFEQTLEEILNTPRAQALYKGFTNHIAVEPLCSRCGYATITKRFRK